MKIAVLSDIHANLPALEAVFKRIKRIGVDQIVVIGDLIGYGPFPNEVVALVRQITDYVIRGNHEDAFGEYMEGEYSFGRCPNLLAHDGMMLARSELSAENAQFIFDLADYLSFNQFEFAHGAFWGNRTKLYVERPEDFFEQSRRPNAKRFAFIGHTHIPAIFNGDHFSMLDFTDLDGHSQYIVNVGSVGQPRDCDPRASFGLLDLGLMKYQTIRVPYDIGKTIKRAQEKNLSPNLARRLISGI
ncbi:hypothetical protein A2533_04045 [Candidatus Falkowbacteria bacterium RIFOXYD2_FULL_35_9]|uniref:Calcineurin-like phosphoesterase domain-containing protein n=1 Tax=Candidatus Falkowbacteria bacterium RIFOXYC2_FULL_36_12 TaxID=1798002 RepID=A0A1F5SY60_9BACT|nr:MAG: hypothetical protein A2300_00380 [Candidatus Falkowbacteria bacterium RIFOXYB2_FULL_35_7]OGF31630.1 MAG: hypothetical protein A2478_04040 [Candidatus Falkowbacteria bacterium RIFOXYC2_FULL_36_12]OGF34176.1 MAG: hypothetical protein A2223_01970 [Candidatus Falkowbacteria bacterium RIFOXYA2_FULL_35_8]OGF46698.1 MAG: hypothetical protein A2533_04045 [Candidatus Falkowbacteria bacterium RIFOXYD2_FULL_35_9]